VVQGPNNAPLADFGESCRPSEVQGFSVERERGLGGGVPGEPECTGVNCTNENRHLQLVLGTDEEPEGTDGQAPCNSVTRPPADEDASDPVIARLAALLENWQHAHDQKAMRRGLLDILRALEEE